MYWNPHFYFGLTVLEPYTIKCVMSNCVGFPHTGASFMNIIIYIGMYVLEVTNVIKFLSWNSETRFTL